jgi:hypothetical protein
VVTATVLPPGGEGDTGMLGGEGRDIHSKTISEAVKKCLGLRHA